MSKPSSFELKCLGLVHIHMPVTAEVMIREQWNHREVGREKFYALF